MKFLPTQIALMFVASLAVPIAYAVERYAGPEPQQPISQTDDAALMAKVRFALLGDGLMAISDIRVRSERGLVTLSGIVDKKDSADRAIRLASEVPGVRSVSSQLKVKAGS